MIIKPEVIEKAKELRSQGIGWRALAPRLGVSEYALRCVMEPGYREKKLADSLHARRLRYKFKIVNKRQLPRVRPQRYNYKTGHTVKSSMPVAVEVEADRDRRLSLRPASITAALLGDPLPGYSALDRRHG